MTLGAFSKFQRIVWVILKFSEQFLCWEFSTSLLKLPPTFLERNLRAPPISQKFCWWHNNHQKKNLSTWLGKEEKFVLAIQLKWAARKFSYFDFFWRGFVTFYDFLDFLVDEANYVWMGGNDSICGTICCVKSKMCFIVSWIKYAEFYLFLFFRGFILSDKAESF